MLLNVLIFLILFNFVLCYESYLHDIEINLKARNISGPGLVHYAPYYYNFFEKLGETCNAPDPAPSCNPLYILGFCSFIISNFRWTLDKAFFHAASKNKKCNAAVSYFANALVTVDGQECGPIKVEEASKSDMGYFDYDPYIYKTSIFPINLMFYHGLFHKAWYGDCNWYNSAATAYYIIPQSAFTIVKKTCSNQYDLVSFSVVKFKWMVNCPFGFYGRRCWYSCYENDRYTCGRHGTQICKIPWGRVLVRYATFYAPFVAIRPECRFFDKCLAEGFKNHTKYCPDKYEDCIAYDNQTFICTNFRVNYHSTLEPDLQNMTAPVFLVGEQIQCFIDYTLVDKRLINGSSCLFELSEDEIPTAFTNLLEFHENKLEIIATEEYSETISIVTRIIAHKGYLDKRLERLVFISMPTEYIELVNLTYGHGYYVHLGQTVYCKSNGWPQRAIIYMMILLTNNFLFKPITYQNGPELPAMFIPGNAMIGEMEINCSAFSQYDGLRTEGGLTSIFKVTLRGFAQIKWYNHERNLYLINDTIFCLAHAFVAYNTDIVRVKGTYTLERPTDLSVRFNIPKGGYYEIACKIELMGLDMMQSTVIKVTILKIPTLSCFPLFGRLPDFKIQCNHDGYPNDATSTKIVMINFMTREVMAFTKNGRSIRIPMNVEPKKYLVDCNVTYYIFNNTASVSKRIEFGIKPGWVDEQGETPESRLCSTFGDSPTSDYMSELPKNILRFESPQFYHELKAEMMNAKAKFLIFCFCIMLFSLFYFMYLINECYVDSEQEMTIDYNSFRCYCRKSRTNQDMLYLMIGVVSERYLIIQHKLIDYYKTAGIKYGEEVKSEEEIEKKRRANEYQKKVETLPSTYNEKAASIINLLGNVKPVIIKEEIETPGDDFVRGLNARIIKNTKNKLND